MKAGVWTGPWAVCKTPARAVPSRASVFSPLSRPRFFGVDLGLKERDLLAAVEEGFRLYVWALGRRCR